MNELKFNSQICTTIEQSKRLLELGLKPETADMRYSYKPQHLADTTPEKDWLLQIATPLGTDIPAWSLHRLIELYKDVDYISLWSLEYVNYNRLIECISFAIKHGAFNKEYLKP